MYTDQDLVTAGGAIAMVCIALILFLRQRPTPSSRTWQGILLIAAAIGASASMFGFLKG